MYQVPNMQLIPQKNYASCWYASAQMVIQWKRSSAFFTAKQHPDPSQVREVVTWEVERNGLINPRVLALAKHLGLQIVPPMSVSLPMLEGYVRHYGPLWTNGKEHIVVIAGVDQLAKKVLVYDPWPVNVGKIEWRLLSDWYIGTQPPGPNDPDSSRDTGPGVAATFLYHP